MNVKHHEMANTRFQSVDERSPLENLENLEAENSNGQKRWGEGGGLPATVLNIGRFMAIVLSPIAQSKRESNGGPE